MWNFLIKKVSSSSNAPLLNCFIAEDFEGLDKVFATVVFAVDWDWAEAAAKAEANDGPAIFVTWDSCKTGGGEVTLEIDSAESFEEVWLATTTGADKGLLLGAGKADNLIPGGWLNIGEIEAFWTKTWGESTFFLEAT